MMNRFVKSICVVSIIIICVTDGLTQNKADSLTDELKNSIFNNFKHFRIGFYVDAYFNMEFDNKKDTAGIVPFMANCPMTNQVRLNVAAFEMFYDAEKVRGKLQTQLGDDPNLLAAPEKQWIKDIRQASIGFRIVKNLWTDIGFKLAPCTPKL